MNARIFGQVVASEVDGPNTRAVVHFAGCSLRCKGCFNRELQANEGPNVRELAPEALALEILKISSDVTISGGEPLEQPAALFALLAVLREHVSSVILFTGKTLDTHTIGALGEAGVDVIVDGPYLATKPEREWLRGSSNQRILRLSDRIPYSELRSHGVQVQVTDRLVITGFPTPELLAEFSEVGQ